MGNRMLGQQPKTKKPPIIVNDNILESVRSIGSSVGKTVTKDVAGKIGSDVLQSLFGASQKSGELKPQETIDFREQQPEVAPIRRVPEAPKQMRSEDAQLKQQLEAVRQELQGLAQSIKKLHQEIHNAVMETPVAPGVYHLNFFEQLKSFIKSLKEQVDDSNTWLAAFHSRKKKAGYWGMYKKHGTTFGLSSERSLATSSG